MDNDFITSDSHWFHKKIIEYCNRPFSSIEEMNEVLIQRWNEVVKPKDTVYHLGDFIWSSSIIKIKEICDRLNGKKILIFGNHDDKKQLLNSGCFSQCFSYYDFKFKDKFIVLSHYPMEVWNKKHHGAVHFHGHCHGTLERIIPNRFDAGVDSHNYYPISLEEKLNELTK